MRRWKNKQLDGLDVKKIWKNGATYLILFLAVGAMTFFGVCDPSGQQSILPGGDAAKVAGIEISSLDFKREYRSAYSRYQNQLKDRFDPKMLQLSKRVMEQMVDDYILYAEAKKSGISAKDFEVTKLIIEADAFKDKTGKFDTESFSNYLRNAGYTEKSFEEQIRRDITNRKLRMFLQDTMLLSDEAVRWKYRVAETKLDLSYIKVSNDQIKTKISDQEVSDYLKQTANKEKVKNYYESNKSEFNTPKKVHAFHILSAFKGARNVSGEAALRSKEDAKARAEDLLKKARTEGSDFKALAKEFSDEPTAKTKSGDLGYFQYEDMVEEFSKPAFDLKKGQLSEVIESPFGFHIIKVVGIQEAQSTSLEAAEKSIARKQLEKINAPLKLAEFSNTIIAKLKEGDPSAEKLLKEIDAEWKTTGEFGLDTKFIPGLGSSDTLKEAALSLSKAGQLYEKPIDVSGGKVVLKLATIKEADMTKLTPERLNELKEEQRFFEAYTLFAHLSKKIQDDYKSKGLVSINNEFSNLDVNGRPGS